MLIAASSSFTQIVQIAAAFGAGIVLIAFVALIAWPAWNSYGRTWERASALLLSLYVLVAMLGIGSLVGLAVFGLLGERI
jgi:phosphoglycerol transferase MdoB-like AlkP superfamily enzyme